MKFINGKLDGSSFSYSVKMNEVDQMIKECYKEKFPDCKVENAKLYYVDGTYDTDGYYYGEVTIKRKIEILGKIETCEEMFDIRGKELSDVFRHHFNKLGLSLNYSYPSSNTHETICFSCKKLQDSKENNQDVEETEEIVQDEEIEQIEENNQVEEITEEIKTDEEILEEEKQIVKEEIIALEPDVTLEDIIDYLSIIKEYAKRKAKQQIAKSLMKILD